MTIVHLLEENAKKYAKIWWSQKKDVILHRGFVRALGACPLKIQRRSGHETLKQPIGRETLKLF